MRMSLADQVDFTASLAEMGIFSSAEHQILLFHTDEWGTEAGMANETVLIKEIINTVKKYSTQELDKETVG